METKSNQTIKLAKPDEKLVLGDTALKSHADI